MRAIPLVLAVVLAAPLPAQGPGPVLPNQGLEIVQRFGGAAKMVVSAEMESAEPPPIVIADEAAFQKFAALLPDSDVTRTGVKVPNPDPLSLGPRIDWSRYMLLVVFDSQTLSFPPNVSRVEVRAGRLTAVVEYPDTKNVIEAKPPEMGAYGAALVVRNAGTVEWNNPGHRAQEAQRESMMMFLPKTE